MKRLLFIFLIAIACDDNTTGESIQQNKKTEVTNEALFEQAVTIDFTIKQYVANRDNQNIEFEIISDSRCPSAVTCVWAGEVTASIKIFDRDRVITVVLKPGESEAVVIGNKKQLVKLIAVLPYPVDAPIDTDAYHIVLEITPA